MQYRDVENPSTTLEYLYPRISTWFPIFHLCKFDPISSHITTDGVDLPTYLPYDSNWESGERYDLDVNTQDLASDTLH